MFNKKITTSLMLLAGLPVVQCNVFAGNVDPTRPPIFRPKPVSASSQVKLNVNDFKISSILISDQRKVAVINGQVVAIGDKVKARDKDKNKKRGQATVLAISSQSVKLGIARREFVVRLPSSRYSKIEALVTKSGEQEVR